MKKKIDPPIAVYWSHLYRSDKRVDSAENFSRYGCYLGPRGVVFISEYKWKNNSGTHIETDFETIVDGRRHRMTLPIVDLSEKSIKTYSARFLKNIKR